MQIFLLSLFAFPEKSIKMTEKIALFAASIHKSLTDNTFVKISLGNYKGPEENLKNIYAKRILIKNEEKLSFTFRYKTKDIVKNYSAEEGIGKTQQFLTEGFFVATLFTTGFDVHFENFGNRKAVIKNAPPTFLELPPTGHDKTKNRLISADEKLYLTSLNITDEAGKVLPNAQDKYRQINQYIEILSSLLQGFPADEPINVVDMGSGKGYLTFALYDYLTKVLNRNAQVTGVEIRPELVELCNSIARDASFENLRFAQGTIGQFDCAGIDILIALHACDTATDDAIGKGIKANAGLIVVAPCCHKQIRREMEKQKTNNELDFLTKYGIFLERQAEMVTDGIRALILEYFGYKTNVFEFIADVHTPKNVMIVGVKRQKVQAENGRILQKIKEIKAYFGIGYHHLERIMEI